MTITKPRGLWREARLAASFGGVGLIGFITDANLLHLGVELGLAAWSARIISLFCAMQATFTINGFFVFKNLNRRRLASPWFRYMLANGFGNFCNYWIFVTLVSLHWPVVSKNLFALTVSSISAWMINYAGTRLFVFRPAAPSLVPDDPSHGPEPDEYESSRR